ncbi:GNAT family N-acetyltransferase [Robertkochia flava]|uniref:GNAT family N-acetyltransferase n=1 Tax=Robertkochia flava TaxID=3447986 RepID=UPI001CCAF34C|nr:GNAT family protein [Robertkochia marina]
MDIHIRPFKRSDIGSLAKHANNPKIARFLSDQFTYPYSEEDAAAFIEQALSRNPLRSFAITINNEVIGGIGIHPQEDIHRKNAEIGYWVAEPYWGKGIMTKAISWMLEYGFATFDIERIFAKTFFENQASQKVLLKNGFKKEAHFKKTVFKNGVLHDEFVFGIRREEVGSRE